MRRLLMAAVAAFVFATPALAADAEDATERRDLTVALKDGSISIAVLRNTETSTTHYVVKNVGNDMIGTGTSFQLAMASLSNNYAANGYVKGTLPTSLTSIYYRADGMVSEVVSTDGDGLDRVTRVKLHPFKDMVFVIHDWVTSYEGQPLGVGSELQFSFFPTATPNHMMVITTTPE